MFSQTANAHIEQDRTAFFLFFHRAGVTLNLIKCNLFMEKIDYSGNVIRPSRLELAFHTTDVICSLKPPKNMMDLKNVLG